MDIKLHVLVLIPYICNKTQCFTKNKYNYRTEIYDHARCAIP